MPPKPASKLNAGEQRALVPAMVHRIVGIPRLIRVLLVALFALAVTLAVSPLVDYVYDRHFFSTSTVIVPSLVSSGLGLVMYVIGWWLMVGTVGEKPVERRALLGYFVVGVVAIVFVALLITSGVSLLNMDA